MLKTSVLLTYTLFLLFTCFYSIASAQTGSANRTDQPGTSFTLEDGDRVVFLGNSLFENDEQFGYLELALTTHWPGRNVTFRNLGWSGDNVFGEARGNFTNPPTAYESLIEQITNAKPTVVFIAYGGIEAQQGEEGLKRFQAGLNQLLDKIDQLGAVSILVSPIPILSAQPDENTIRQNAMLERYASAISQLASSRKKRYLDIFKPIQEISKKAVITENGIHLNATGYYYLATVFENALGLKPGNEAITIDASKSLIESTVPTELLTSNQTSLSFKVNDNYLPLPSPVENDKLIEVDNGRPLKITGLKKGFYTLTIDSDEVVTASAKQWAEGVVVRQGPLFTRAEQLRQLILEKNKLHFFQYRPLNQTYIIGFRSYEQGRHKKGLEEQSFIITWLEGQIAAVNRQSTSGIYHLTQLK